MNTTLILIGIGCIIGAIIGGGVKLVQIELDPVKSLWRQILLGCFGALLVLSGVIVGRTTAPVGPIPPSPAPSDRPTASAGYVIADSQYRRLTAADVAHLSPSQLRIARNEIYARHGFRFQSADLANYFSQLSWYSPSSDNVTLSPVEQANIALIAKYEK